MKMERLEVQERAPAQESSQGKPQDGSSEWEVEVQDRAAVRWWLRGQNGSATGFENMRNH